MFLCRRCNEPWSAVKSCCTGGCEGSSPIAGTMDDWLTGRGRGARRFRGAATAVIAGQRLAQGGRDHADRRARVAQERKVEAAYLAQVHALSTEFTSLGIRWKGFESCPIGFHRRELGVWEVASLDSITESDLIRWSTSGRWADLAPTVRLEWKATSKNVDGFVAKASERAEGGSTLWSAFSAPATAYDSGRGISEVVRGAAVAPSATDGKTAVVAILEPFALITGTDAVEFSNEVAGVLGPEMMEIVGGLLPFIGPICQGITAGKEAYNLGNMILERSAATGAVLRPSTPRLAREAVVKEYSYLIHRSEALLVKSLAQGVAGIFDGGLASGPVGALASLAIKVHQLYRAFLEKKRFRQLVAAGKHYEALQASPVIGAFVLGNYPAIGLVDPQANSRASAAPYNPDRVWKVWQYFRDPDVLGQFKAIRTASARVAGISPLIASATVDRTRGLRVR
ncbi:MAG: hypothetical protein ACI9WU_005025 [Myxococcota bacterium]|jgi:hypothetical protein